MLSKEQLIFDPTAASTADCDTVGSFVLGAGGDAVTSTDLGGGVQALDVNVAGGSLTTTVDLNFATDQVDASGSVIALDAATLAALEDINATVSGTVALDAATLAALENITVTATDLDIRDLAFATDSVDVSGSTVALDAASLAALEDVTATVSGTVALDAATLAALESITVTATDLDIRDLSATTDSVSIGDGTDTLAINTDGSINTVTAGCSTGASSAVSVTNTATQLVGSALTDRKTMTIQNRGSQGIYIGPNSGVTTTTGLYIPKGASAEYCFGPGLDVHAITSSGTADVRIMELA